jgi:hypothetical protein
MASSGKILSIGLGDLVSARNAALRSAGYDVVAAISLEDIFRLCGSCRFDVAVIGHAFTLAERVEFVRCIQGDFRLPVILIEDGQVLKSLHADSHVHVNESPEKLISAIKHLMNGHGSAAIAV